MFKFVGYKFDKEKYIATFNYLDDKNNLKYTEKVRFQKNFEYDTSLNRILGRALELCFLLIGTSYYKAHPTSRVEVNVPIDAFKAHFLNVVYQDGLSQFAFENNLTRRNLAHFVPNFSEKMISMPLPYPKGGVLALQSGGKDSIVTATLLNYAKKDWSALYVGSSENYPRVLEELDVPLERIVRHVDIAGLGKAEAVEGYMNGHVPVTYILMSLAVVQAILDRKSYVITSIGHEGEEPHSIIADAKYGDLAVNHQWSKTFIAEKYFADYIHRYISADFEVGSLIRGYSELRISEIFAKECWERYGRKFSSCNVANYRQKNNNSKLTWCGDCAKCANSYLVFAPFVPQKELKRLFGRKDLFVKPELVDEFKGLLGVDGEKKPFECVGEINELRQAYEMKLPGYANLPFEVPKNDGFDYKKNYEVQNFVKDFLKN